MAKRFVTHLPGMSDTDLQALDTLNSPIPNHLYYGDNLTIMGAMKASSVDLIYLDPPFNSQRNYNLIYTKLTGQPVPEQEEAFCDAWYLDAEKDKMARDMPKEFLKYGVDEEIIAFWTAWTEALRHTQPRLLAYLIYMTYRLFEMRRILKPTGSLYLHCDPTASHYIKVILDGVFGQQNFRNEIIWKRTSSHNRAKRWGPVHDVIFCYGKSEHTVWNRVVQDYDEDYIKQFYRHKDTKGQFRISDLTGPGSRAGDSGQPWRDIDPTLQQRHWEPPPDRALPNGFVYPNGYAQMPVRQRLDVLDAQGLIYWPKKAAGIPGFKRYLIPGKGAPIQDVIADIPPIQAHAQERLGYPTQKPIALLERIIQASSNPGDVVFDPFCGCGTAVYAAHLSGRKWIGCDIAILSVEIVRDVLFKRYGLQEGEQFDVSGVPTSVDGAQRLFNRDPHQFQHWAVELAGGFASTKRSNDKGIDGRIHFETRAGLKNMVISVKGGKHLDPHQIRELRGTLGGESTAEMAGFICLSQPTRGMRDAAAVGGMYTYQGKDYERVQIRTIQELLDGKGFDTPSKVQTLGWLKQPMLPM